MRERLGSPSIFSRQRARKALRAGSSIGNSRPGSSRTSGTGYRLRWRVGVEGADRIDLVAEQVHAVGHQRAHREQIDQPAAHRVFARRHHLAHMAVAGQRELRLQRGLVQPHLLLEVEGVAGHEAGRCQPRQRGGGGQQHHVEFATAHAPQRGQALGDQVLVRREAVVGQRLPVGEQRHAQLGREERQFVHQPLRVGRIGGDDAQQLPGVAARQRMAGQQQGVGRADRAGQGVALAAGDGGQLHGRCGQHKTPRNGCCGAMSGL